LLAVKYLRWSVALGFVIACFGSSAAATLAQQAGTPAKAVRKPLKNTENPEFKSERLTRPVDLPDVPMFQGQGTQFVTGTSFPNVKGGQSVTMQFTVKEAPDVVLSWYKDTLSTNRWTPLSNTAGKDGLAYMKANNICQIMTMGPSKPTSKCDLLVRYKFYKATKFASN
jgi:hypothetical protein